jgi:hypothetical protein
VVGAALHRFTDVDLSFHDAGAIGRFFSLGATYTF